MPLIAAAGCRFTSRRNRRESGKRRGIGQFFEERCPATAVIRLWRTAVFDGRSGAGVGSKTGRSAAGPSQNPAWMAASQYAQRSPLAPVCLPIWPPPPIPPPSRFQRPPAVHATCLRDKRVQPRPPPAVRHDCSAPPRVAATRTTLGPLPTRPGAQQPSTPQEAALPTWRPGEVARHALNPNSPCSRRPSTKNALLPTSPFSVTDNLNF